MRAYIDGKINKNNDKVDFFLGDLWFASPDYENNLEGDLEENEECILITGVFIESVCKGTVYYAKWDGIDVNGEEINSVEELKKLLEGKHLINGMACFNEDVDFSDISVGFSAPDGEWAIPDDRICNKIQFIW